MPDGYRTEDFSGALSSADRQTVQYLPLDDSRRGERISVVASTLTRKEFVTAYGLRPTAVTTTVRSRKRAAAYVVGNVDDPHARRALVWEERPGVIAEIFAFADVKTMRSLTQGVREIDQNEK